MYKLLIADDEPLIRRGIRKLIDFESLNIDEIYEAQNGQQVIDIVAENSVDIVLLDINMPYLDGLTVAEKIKKINPEIKIAIITGYNYFDYAQRAIKIGVDDYILKPISKKEVAEIISKLVYALDKVKRDNMIDNLSIEVEEEVNITQREKIERLIEANYTNSQFSQLFLAERLDLSCGYLSVIFKKYFGINFQDYLLKKRMESAKILLLSTELKNYEIAELVGIEDSNYFSVKFKKYFGHSPKQYKELIVKNENK